MSKARWLKLSVDIMQDEKIRLIRRMEYGNDYFALWISLLCYAMQHESSALYIAEGVPVTAGDLAHLYQLELLAVANGLAIFEKYGMIHHDEAGAIVVSKFDEYQSLDEMERKRGMATERQRKSRINKYDVTHDVTKKSVTCHTNVDVTERDCHATEVEEEVEVEKEFKTFAQSATAGKDPPGEAPLVSMPHKKPQKQKSADTLSAESFSDIEAAWDAAYKAESGQDYVRNYGRDRKLLAPLIRAVGADEVRRRVEIYFALPAQYWARSVVKFANRFNEIPAAACGKAKRRFDALDLRGAMGTTRSAQSESVEGGMK